MKEYARHGPGRSQKGLTASVAKAKAKRKSAFVAVKMQADQESTQQSLLELWTSNHLTYCGPPHGPERECRWPKPNTA